MFVYSCAWQGRQADEHNGSHCQNVPIWPAQLCPHGKSSGVSPGPGWDLHTCVEGSGGRGFCSWQCTDGLTGGGQYNNLQNKLEKRHHAVSWAVEYNRYGNRDGSSTTPRITSASRTCQIHTLTWSRSHDICPTWCLCVLIYSLSSCTSAKHAHLVLLGIRGMSILFGQPCIALFTFQRLWPRPAHLSPSVINTIQAPQKAPAVTGWLVLSTRDSSFSAQDLATLLGFCLCLL